MPVKNRKTRSDPSEESEVRVATHIKGPEKVDKIASTDPLNTSPRPAAAAAAAAAQTRPVPQEKAGSTDATAPSSADAAAKSPSDPEKRPKRNPILLYRQVFCSRSLLQKANPKLSATQDRLLASIGYPAKLVGYSLANKELANLSGAISDYRTFYRMVTTPATLQWTLDLLLDNQNPDRLDRFGDYIQAIAGSVYQILEDIAYLASKGIIKISDKRQNRLWAVSCMFWAAHVFIELLRIPYYRLVHKKPIDLRTLVVNSAWAPLTIHWSTETGICNDGWVGSLGTFACWPNMVYQWRNA